MTDTEEPLTTFDKFDLLIKDFTTLMDSTKSLSARMKVLQKEVNKTTRGQKPRKPVDPDAPKRVSALNKPVAISNELCLFLGFEPDSEHSRHEVTSSLTEYVKKHDLQDPNNRRYILLDSKDEGKALKKLLRDPDQPVTFFNIQRYLKPHYPISEKDKKALFDESAKEPVPVLPETPKSVVPDVAVVEDAPKEVTKPPPKKRAVRNPKSA